MILLRASNGPARTSIVKVSAPNVIAALSDIIAVRMVGQDMKICERKQVVVPINHL